MSKIMRVIGNSVRVFGLVAIMFAFAGTALAAPSASAASLGTAPASAVIEPLPISDPPVPVPAPELGKLDLVAVDALKGATIADATVGVYHADSDGTVQIVAKGLTNANGNFSTYLAPGVYEVKVTANGYKKFSRLVTITADQATNVKAGLRPAYTFNAASSSH